MKKRIQAVLSKIGNHAEFISASPSFSLNKGTTLWITTRKRETLKQVQGGHILYRSGFCLTDKNVGQKPNLYACKAFTLIELLVVVLIIGILAAIAVPQYQVTVLKSRMASLLPLMRAIKEANERYYFENNHYADDLNLLDIKVPPGDKVNGPEGGRMCYKNGTCFDNMFAGASITGGIGSDMDADDTCFFDIYFDHSAKPGVITCGKTNSKHPKCAQICKSMGYNN